jgi:hypothetical protein
MNQGAGYTIKLSAMDKQTSSKDIHMSRKNSEKEKKRV